MAISKARPPSGVDRNLQDLYRVVNQLVDAVNKFERNPDQTGGRAGDIRIAENDDGTFEIQARSDKNWFKADLTRKD